MAGIRKGIYNNAIVTVDNDGNVQRLQSGPRVATRTATSLSAPAIALATPYQNTSGFTQFIVLSAIIAGGGGGDSTLSIKIGAANPPVDFTIPGGTIEGTIGGEAVTISFMVPPGLWWEAFGTNHLTTATAIVAVLG